jgi:alkanesulfonate monooxygenase SsuD/methylene tetrahydromethanopterin reductase-like flavin-dependent oxidoreductase (luciferase family)
MRYGFYLPTRGAIATREGILALAREGERLGLHSAMIADHIVFPVESDSAYPYTVDGRFPGGGDALETFSILGVVAGATERLRLVPSVLVLPYRNPVLTAKMVASLDVLSGGRVTLGVSTATPTSAPSRSRCRSRIRRSGSAAIRRLPCAGPHGTAMAGIRWAPSLPRRCRRRRCARISTP